MTTRAGISAFLGLLALLGFTSTAGGADPAGDDLVDVTLVADVHAVAPGEPFRLGVRFDIADEWHINWINPGDAGLAPSIAWRLPAGFAAGDLQWPYPERFDAGPLVIFGYDSGVMLWTTVTPPADIRPGERIELSAGVDWLACREACVPGQAETSLVLPVAEAAVPDTATARAMDAAATRVPVSSPQWSASADYGQDDIELRIAPVRPLEGPPPAGVFFYPDMQGIIDNAADQRLESSTGGVTLVIPRSAMVRATPGRLTGVVVSKTGWAGPPALRIDVVLESR